MEGNNMNQNQCVPSWEELAHINPILHPPLPSPPTPKMNTNTSRSHSTSVTTGLDVSMQDYAVAELTWENGQITKHGLGLPRVPNKSSLGGASWADKPTARASGTLESIVNQAIKHQSQIPNTPTGGACNKNELVVPWFNPNPNNNNNIITPTTATATTTTGCSSIPAMVSMTMDALVPTSNGGDVLGGVGCSTRVGSCSAAARVPVSSEWSVSVSEDTRNNNNESLNYQNNNNACEQVGGGLTNGLTSTSLGTSPEITKTTTVDDHDSACHSRPQRGEEEENRKKGSMKSSLSTKRSRAAAIHNQSERKRRDKINQRMKTLQKLVPSSSKTDKASMLDEVIDYLKQLQAQVQMMSRIGTMPSMMMPALSIHQQLQMTSMMSQMGMGMGGMGIGMGMGMGMGMNMGLGMHGIDNNHNQNHNHNHHLNLNNNINSAMATSRPLGMAGMSPAILNPVAFMPWDATTSSDRFSSQQAMAPADPFLACMQSQPTMPMEAYNKMASMYQQLQQQQQQQKSAPK